MWENYLPTEIHFGVGAFKNAKDLFERFEAKKIFLVTGKHAMKKTGHTDELIEMLKPAEVTLFDEVEANPLLETGQKGIDILQELKPDLVIGLGGGSAIDAAKAMAITAKHEGSLADYFTGKKDYTHKGYPFVAISSTPGSSSEMTCWSVFTFKGMKNGYGMHLMYPEIAIVDPELTLTLPQYQTGATGFDILSHSIEAFWSKNATPVSDANALRAIELVFNHLPKAANNLDDINGMTLMSANKCLWPVFLLPWLSRKQLPLQCT
jgi:alcohol dehydrogenase class IV